MKQLSPRCGLILMNLGTPDAPNTSSIRKYLKEFLWDKRVVELPRPFWWLILHLVILPFRPGKIAHAYQSIWLSEGSPLRVISVEQANKLQHSLDEELGKDICQVELAMTYGQPSFDEAWKKLKSNNVEKIFVLPLYPQYSASTTGAAFDQISRVLQSERNIPELRLNRDYHCHPEYINALANAIQRDRSSRAIPSEETQQPFLLFSFHGIPQQCIERGDPYYHHCQTTAKAVAAKLALNNDQWQVSFQSRVGKAAWTQPYTEETVKKLGRSGLKSLDVVCPGFSVDCLETLEEIKVQNREFFEEAGGTGFHYIPALNADAIHSQVLKQLFLEKCADWF